MGSNVKFSISQIAFVLLTISMFGGLFFAVWNLHTQSASLKTDNLNQNAKLQSLRSENENLHNKISELQGFVEAINPNPHSSDETTVMDTLKRLTRQSDSSQSATDLLADALAELIEKKLYTIMDCARDDADNLTDCSLKPGAKGDKGCLGDQGKEGPQGMNGEPGVIGLSGHNGYPGYPGNRGEVGPKGPIGNPGPMGHRGDKGDTGEIGQRGEAGEQGMKGFGLPGRKGEPGMKGVKGNRGFGGNNGQKGDKGMTGEPGPPGPIHPCGGPGWRKVAFIDMTDTSQNCPQGLTLTGYSKRSCGRTHTNREACSSVTFPVGGGQYSRVCGRAKAYHYGYLLSFFGYNFASHGINAQYVAGLSFTHGTPRTHIWTFAAGYYQGISGDNSYRNYRCPCNQGNTYGSPPFVGNDYFCESGVSSYSARGGNIFYPDDPLWDGQGCIHGNPCCSLNKPPWFTKTLPTPTTDDIEMRLCMVNGAGAANIALEQMELYVY